MSARRKPRPPSPLPRPVDAKEVKAEDYLGDFHYETWRVR